MSVLDILIYLGVAIAGATFGFLIFALCYVAKHCRAPDDFNGDQV